MASDVAQARARMVPLLSVRDLRVEFRLEEGTTIAVDGASFDVHSGETLGLVGESGCGKSVIARSILRILDRPGRIAGGQILLRRQGSDLGYEEIVDLASLDPSGREIRSIRGAEISLVFQEPMTSFSPVHTIGDQLTEVIRLHQGVGRREGRRIAVDMLRQVGLPTPDQQMDKYAFQLSGGLRQRAMIAMALSCNAGLLIADEPTTALDVTTQAQILDLLRGLQQRYGMAILLITHDLGVIAQMADRVVVVYLGRVVESAPVDQLFDAPRHPYTQALLRSMPHLRPNPDKRRLVSIAGSVPHAYERPQGCSFHPRCPSVMEGLCDRRVPSMLDIGSDHCVSCFLYEEQ